MAYLIPQYNITSPNWISPNIKDLPVSQQVEQFRKILFNFNNAGENSSYPLPATLNFYFSPNSILEVFGIPKIDIIEKKVQKEINGKIQTITERELSRKLTDEDIDKANQKIVGLGWQIHKIGLFGKDLRFVLVKLS